MWPLPHYLIVCVGLLIAGCGSGDRPTTEGLVHDALGRSIQLPPAISRVVTLAPSVTEMVFAAGAGNMLVGVTLSDSYPPAVSALPRFHTYPVALERIVALDPDLALASDQVNHPDQVRALAELGSPTCVLSSRSVEEMLEQIVELGRLLDTEEFASRTVDSLQSRIERLRKRTASIESRPSVLVLAGAQPLYAFGSESYVHQLVEWGGGISVTGSIGTTTPVLSDEYVLRTAPDV